MKKVEIIQLTKELLKKLHDVGIKVTDYEYLQLFEDYEIMRAAGEKMTYIVAILCERKVYKLLRYYQEDCHFGAV
ncbi:MAG: hypothetical protein IJ698_00265 [Prevotella sp.]|nr:hypothetical protein [Prevotella sp.]